MEKEYNHLKIEKKWQFYWENNNIFTCKNFSKPKYYILDMLPYPSGSGLHVGHVVGYTGSDVIARYKRMKGLNVLHPMGWDSFGLPAEQYAYKTGVDPNISTKKNIENYKKQLKSLGFGYNWSQEINTTDPHYYKWTQWIFTQFYKKGLAEKIDTKVNFCPKLNTVLSNEEIHEGRSIEGGFLVESRTLKQWVLKITKYADRLLEDLDDLDWPEKIKNLQRKWIGKSKGVEIDFRVGDITIVVYTTRPDTIGGVTYIAVAPEHPAVKLLLSKDRIKDVDNYIKKCKSKSDRDREIETKTGIFTGSYALNPVSEEMVPVWIADYVLPYGSSAVMGVPACDQRDLDFANQHDLPVKEVLKNKRYIKVGKLDKISKEIVTNFLELNSFGRKKIHYKLRDWIFSRQRYWGEPIPILFYEDNSCRALELEELPLCLPELKDYQSNKNLHNFLLENKSWVEFVDKGKLVKRETSTMPQWAGSCWYFLRYCDPLNNKEPWSKNMEKYWMPVDLYIGGAEHAVLHLLYARFVHKVLYDLDIVSTKEPFKSLRNQGIVLNRSYRLKEGDYISIEDVIKKGDKYFCKKTNEEVVSKLEKMSKSKLNGILPDKIILQYGADSLRLYELFLSPFEKEKIWSTESLKGCHRFLSRVYTMVINRSSDTSSKEDLTTIHQLIKDVEHSILSFSFNTAIAKLMDALNRLCKKPCSVDLLKIYVQLLYPFAPHFGEECWSLLGEKNSIVYSTFPTYKESYLKQETVNMVLQVSGKFRGEVTIQKGASREDALKYFGQDKKLSKFFNQKIKKIIFVKDKIINLVI